jgi:hypothetical protein
MKTTEVRQVALMPKNGLATISTIRVGVNETEALFPNEVQAVGIVYELLRVNGRGQAIYKERDYTAKDLGIDFDLKEEIIDEQEKIIDQLKDLTARQNKQISILTQRIDELKKGR